MLQILFALLAGILTIAAPCILPLLPILLGTSMGQTSKSRPLFIVLGFVLMFSLAALFLSFLVEHTGLNSNTLRLISIIILAIFGVCMIWPEPFEHLTAKLNGLINKADQVASSKGKGNLGGFILGMTLGLVWTPCAGPVLGSILTLVATQKDLWFGSILLIAYSLGAGVPMLLIAYGGQYFTTKVKTLSKYSRLLQQIFGVLIIAISVAFYFNYDTLIFAKISQYFPSFSNVENQIVNPENNDSSQKSLADNGLKNYGKAPDFIGNNHWLNSDPLTIDSLKGKVVLVDFWTYSCINCIRTLPYVTKWYDEYKDKGLVVVGVHTYEFDFEKETANVLDAIKRFNINYPVVQDNQRSIWDNYSNQYWPAEYLVDQNGNVVYVHFGEGNYDHTENAIRALLGLDKDTTPDPVTNLNGIGSPEMYFGTDRLQNLSQTQKPSTESQNYTFPSELNLNTFALDGDWQFTPEHLVLTKPNGKIRLKFHSGKVHIVAESPKPVTLQITVDNKKQPDVVVSESQLYTLFNSEDYNDHVIEINIPDAGFEGFTFTFG